MTVRTPPPVRACRIPILLWILAACPSATALDVILRIGDPAPQIGTGGYTIESFVEPPSIVSDFTRDSGYAVFHVTIAGSGVVANNSHVIYRWSRGSGLQRVARGGDSIVFPDGTRVLTILESPMAARYGAVAYTSQMDDGRRGLVLWRPGVPPLGIARVGQGVVIPCDALAGGPCGPVAGTLGSLPTFADRKGLVFVSESDLLGIRRHHLAFRGVVQNTGGFGTPDALWYRELSEGNNAGTLLNLSNSLRKAEGLGATNVYFDDFTDLSFCSASFLLGLATVSRDAPFVVYRFRETGMHTPLGRDYAPDMVPRRDLHCGDQTGSYLGGLSGAPFDGVVASKGVWWIDTATAVQSQVYSNTVTPAPAPVGATLGAPLGQAPTSMLGDGSVFAARMIGSSANGRAGIYIGAPGFALMPLIYETQVLPDASQVVDRIWSVAVDFYGLALAHLRFADQRQAVRLLSTELSEARTLLTTGDAIMVAPGDVRNLTSFWLLGGTFGNDPVVTGSGKDGLQGAFALNGDAVFVAYYGPSASAPAGAAMVATQISFPLFADGFEDPPPG
jgi:hypothetical protein